jgi:hypothetical protein
LQRGGGFGAIVGQQWLTGRLANVLKRSRYTPLAQPRNQRRNVCWDIGLQRCATGAVCGLG